jgi:hypothetical protein
MRLAAVRVATMQPVHARVGEVVVQKARVYCPVRSGVLQASIRAVPRRDGVKILAGGPGIPYAGVQHFGWPAHNIRATMFLTRGAKDSRPAWMAVYREAIARIVGEI